MDFVERISEESEKPLKISFCTTVKGEERLEQLKKTLPHNLKAAEKPSGWPDGKPWPDVEFVILAYGDPAIFNYVKQHYGKEIADGKIVLGRTDAEYFHFAHAKNVAHRLASGDILCNLDVDNPLGTGTGKLPGFVEWLNRQFTENDRTDIIVRPINMETGKAPMRSLGGRIAMSRGWFNYLRGYNEPEFEGYRGDDRELMVRALSHGMQLVPLGEPDIAGRPMMHSDELRYNQLRPNEKESAQQIANADSREGWNPDGTLKTYNPQQKAEILSPPDEPIQANVDGRFGCAKVDIVRYDEKMQRVVEQEVTLKPVSPRLAKKPDSHDLIQKRAI